MDRLPKRRKIGGIRQRMAKATANEQAGNFTNESQLAALLLELFAWGAMSPQLIQEIAALAVRDLEASIENGQVLGDLRVLAGIGTNGAYKNKCHADLMNKVEHLSQLPEPFRVRVPFALPFGESLQGMLLPHQLFASLWRDYPETWRSSVLPDEQTLQRFWSAVDSHPQMESHPIRDVADYKSKVVPLAVHGDGVPVVGLGKGWSKVMTMFSWYSLIGQGQTKEILFWVWSMYDRMSKGSVSEGTRGVFFAVLRWSFLCLMEGKWPSADFQGKRHLGHHKNHWVWFCFLFLFKAFLSHAWHPHQNRNKSVQIQQAAPPATTLTAAAGMLLEVKGTGWRESG